MCPHQECVSSSGSRVHTWRMCPHLAYASSTGVLVPTWHTRRQLAYLSPPGEHVFSSNRRPCLSTSPSHYWVCAQKIMCLLSCIKSIKRLDSDRGMDRCYYAIHQKVFFHLKQTKNYKKTKMKGGIIWMTNYYRE